MGVMLSGLSRTVGDKLTSVFGRRRSYPTIPQDELAEIEESARNRVERSAPTIRALTGYNRPVWLQKLSKFRTVRSARDLKLDHKKVRLASRVGAFDSFLLRCLVKRMVDVVIVDGLRLECSPNADQLGMTPESLDQWSIKTEEKFDQWASSKEESHIEEILTLYQCQRFAFAGQMRDGEYFGRYHYLDKEGIKLGFLDPEQIENGLTKSGKPHEGIIVGPRGQPIGYNVRKTDNTTVVIPAKTKDGKPLIAHGYMPAFAGQTRGISELAHCLEEADILTSYQLAELYAAVQQSQMSFYVKPSKDAPATDAGLTELMSGALPQQSASLAESPVISEETTNEPYYNELAEISSRQPGAWGLFGLGSGEDLEMVKKTSPNLAYPAFIESIAQYLSASWSMPLSVLKMLFSNNYSASRGELQLFWEVVNQWRAEIVSDLLAPLYFVWLENQIARGEIVCPGYSNPKMRIAWQGHKWYGKSLPQLDPNKQATADKIYVELGATTLKRVARNYNGSDATRNRAALRRELADLTPVPWNNKKGKQS